MRHAVILVALLLTSLATAQSGRVVVKFVRNFDSALST